MIRIAMLLCLLAPMAQADTIVVGSADFGHYSTSWFRPGCCSAPGLYYENSFINAVYYPTGNNYIRGYVSFNVPSLPANHVLTGASFSFRRGSFHNNYSDASFNLHYVSPAWVPLLGQQTPNTYIPSQTSEIDQIYSRLDGSAGGGSVGSVSYNRFQIGTTGTIELPTPARDALAAALGGTFAISLTAFELAIRLEPSFTLTLETTYVEPPPPPVPVPTLAVAFALAVASIRRRQ